MKPFALDDAAAAALWPLRDESAEHIGLLFEAEGRVKGTPTQGGRNNARTGGKFRIPPGSLRGLFHNHPTIRGDAERQFSEQDVLQSIGLDVPSYIVADGQIRRYNPRSADKLARSGQPGEPVLAEIPLEAIRRQIMVETLGRDPNDPRGLRRRQLGLLEPRTAGAPDGFGLDARSTLGLLDPKLSRR